MTAEAMHSLARRMKALAETLEPEGGRLAAHAGDIRTALRRAVNDGLAIPPDVREWLAPRMPVGEVRT